MNRKFKMKLIASLFIPAVGMTGFAYAQDKATPVPTPTPMGTTPIATPATGASPMATTPAATAPRATQAFREVRASKLIGTDVRNTQNENLGEIKDLVVDVNSGRVHYAVLSFGGFLGVGDKLFAYPVSVFTPATDGDKLLLNVDKAKLKAAPGFESKRYPEWNDAKYSGEVDRYFGSTVTTKPANQMLRRASELIGKDVNDRNGKDVGEIDDLVVNMGNGRVHYAVLEFDKSWNLNDKLLAVPLSAFSYKNGRKDLVMNVDKAKLDAKLAFDKNRWPDLNDPKYIVDIDRNLGMFAPAAGTTSNGGMRSDANGAAMRDRTAMTSGSAFADLDANKDGMLSATEAGKDAKVMGMWKQLDKDGDGSVSRTEFMAKQTAMKKLQ